MITQRRFCIGYHPPPNRIQSGFGLLELIGVLAVIAIVAALALPFLTLSIDRAVYDEETANLNSFESALQRSIARLGYVTNAAHLADQIAAELGVPVSTVATNARGQPRFFLVDPGLQIGGNGNGLPYWQTDSGSIVKDSGGRLTPPVNPRLMVITSLGPPFRGLTNGAPPSAYNFDLLWNSAAGVVPSVPGLADWHGKTSDLRLQRIHLSGLFIRLLLSRNDSTQTPRFSITGADFAAASPLPSGGIDGYFFQKSVLCLYNHDGSLDSKQVLTQDRSFVYDQNVWRGSIEASQFMNGLDLRAVAHQFLGAFPNPAASSSQESVVQAMIRYFDAYRGWAEPPSNFGNGALKNAAAAAQSDLITVIQGLYAFPGQAPVETPCP